MNFVQTKRLSDKELRALPKIELHRHLEGSLRLSTVAEILKTLGQEVPVSHAQQVDHFLVTTPMRDLKTVLDKFWRSQSILHSEEVISRITFEAIEDAVADGIRLLELRYSFTFIEENHPALNHQKVLNGIHKGMQMAAQLPIGVGMICTMQRTLPMSVSIPVMEFVTSHRDQFVGVDLADDELAQPPKNFIELFELAAKANIPITIHAGESLYPESAKAVQAAIELLQARRIGHGVQIAKDTQVMNFVREKNVTLELCPTSNYLTNSVSSLQSHPFRQLLNAGVRVTINSDDPGIFGIDLTNEYKVLQDHHQFSEADFKRCNDYALQASFLDKKIKDKFWSLK